jgi:hypothetical protein
MKKLPQDQQEANVTMVVSPGSRSCALRTDCLATRDGGRAARSRVGHLSRCHNPRPTRKLRRGLKPGYAHRELPQEGFLILVLILRGAFWRKWRTFLLHHNLKPDRQAGPVFYSVGLLSTPLVRLIRTLFNQQRLRSVEL